MKTIISSLIIFLLVIVGAGYLLRDHYIPFLSSLGRDIDTRLFGTVYESFDIPESTIPASGSITEESQAIKKESTSSILSLPRFTELPSYQLADTFDEKLPEDAQCTYSLNKDYIVCTSLSELMDYVRPVAIDERELEYKSESSIRYYPLPDFITNQSLERYGEGSTRFSKSSGGSGYEEYNISLVDDQVGLFDINIEEERDLSSFVVAEQQIIQEYEESQEFLKLLESTFDVNISDLGTEDTEMNLNETTYTKLVSIVDEFSMENVFALMFSPYRIPEDLLKRIDIILDNAPAYIEAYQKINLTEEERALLPTMCGDGKKDIFGQDFVDSLNNCISYTCEFNHPLLPGMMTRTVEPVSGTCVYTEQMPNNSAMTCSFSPEEQKQAANYYQSFVDESDNKDNSILSGFLNNGTCVISNESFDS